MSRKSFHRDNIQSPLRSIARGFLPSAAGILTLLLSTASSNFAGSATWKQSPTTDDWFTAADWTPRTVPNGPGDTATFASSRQTDVFFPFDVEVNGIVFKPGASAFTIASEPTVTPTLTISGVGITNNSGIVQNFVVNRGAAQILFLNSATAGSLTAFTSFGTMGFGDTSTAGNASLNNIGGFVNFANTATAGDATFTNNSVIIFSGSSSAGNGTFNNPGGLIIFSGTSTGGNATFTNQDGGLIVFNDFNGTSNAGTGGDATFINDGAAVSGGFAGETLFNDTGDAGNATLIANGSLDGGDGGSIQFATASTGGTARVEVFGNGNLDISRHDAPGLTTGSIEGDGDVFLGANNLAVGTNNLGTTFSGVIQDGGTNGGTGIISGAVNVATATSAATLLPGSATIPGTLTMQSALTFNSRATYQFVMNSSTPVADKVVANGVTINRSAQFTFTDLVTSVLPIGTVFTVISNTSANRIAGTFANLADRSTFRAGSNTFQVNYKGGDGNDLTLTIVP